MENYQARVLVRLKNGILDPGGKAIAHALDSLDFSEIDDVKTGKIIEFSIKSKNESEASARIERACEQLLANTVIEEYSFDISRIEAD